MGAGASVNAHESDAVNSSSNSRTTSQGSFKKDAVASTFSVSFGTSVGFKLAGELPDSFLIKINYESLDFVHIGNQKPIIQFPYQHIICWGSSSAIFKFNVFNTEDGSTIQLVLNTKHGKAIEETTMTTVRKLMVDIEKKAVTKEEFTILIREIIDHSELKDDWLRTIDQFSTGRTFLAKQCMDLMLLISPMAPFERVDLACLLYTRILSKESFQLVVNTFDDKEERENVIHRIGQISSKGERGRIGDEETNQLVSDCKLVGVTSPSIIRNATLLHDSKEVNAEVVGVVDPLDLQSPRTDRFCEASSLGSPFSVDGDGSINSPAGDGGGSSTKYPDGEKRSTDSHDQSKQADNAKHGASSVSAESADSQVESPPMSPQRSPINRSYKGSTNPFDVGDELHALKEPEVEHSSNS